MLLVCWWAIRINYYGPITHRVYLQSHAACYKVNSYQYFSGYFFLSILSYRFGLFGVLIFSSSAKEFSVLPIFTIFQFWFNKYKLRSSKYDPMWLEHNYINVQMWPLFLCDSVHWHISSFFILMLFFVIYQV